uniref:Actin-like protein arp6 n=1 Tax=Zeugodacus cucurbitae TaxID=28588 RepID=A0A0A1XSU5_ZEUCU
MLSEEDKKLCALVKQHPELYDKNHLCYGNVQATKKAWLEIRLNMGIFDIDFKLYWGNLLATYAPSDYDTDSGPNVKKSYYLPEPMEFLRPHLYRETAVDDTENAEALSTDVLIYQEPQEMFSSMSASNKRNRSCVFQTTHEITEDGEAIRYRVNKEVIMRVGTRGADAKESSAIAKRNPYQ